MRIATLIVALAVTVAAGLSARAAPSTLPGSEPMPLRGVPLDHPTGLRLVVAANPPVVLDIDTGKVSIVPNIPRMKRGVLWVVGVGGRQAVVAARSASAYPDARFYAVRRRGARVSYLGTGTNVTPANDGRAVWIQSLASRYRCLLRKVGLDGRMLRAPRPFTCASASQGGSLGLVVRRTRVLDPGTGRTVFRAHGGVVAAAGGKLLLAGPGKQFTLIDVATRAQRRLPWPSQIKSGDSPAVDPHGRFVALAFSIPAPQTLDVWLLDTESAKLTQLPGMPAFVSLKYTNMAWTDDGRLVLLAQSRGRDIVAVWRPGGRRLSLKTVHLPERGDSGSDSFAPLH